MEPGWTSSWQRRSGWRAMTPSPTGPPNAPSATEARRQRALERMQALDTAPEPAFDELTWLAAKLCGTPMGLVTLLSTERQWVKARYGVEVPQTERGHAFCNYTVEQSDVLEVHDARSDERFVRNPLVTGPFGLRFYAGAPLLMSEGVAIGALCVLDREPRVLSPDQRRGLLLLSRQVVTQLELRRHLLEEAQMRTRMQKQLHHSDRLASIGELAAGLAHELGTPLAVVIGRARMLATGTGDPDAVASIAKTITEQGERMSAILKQLLEFARRREPRKATHDLRTVLQQGLLLLEGLARKRSAALVLEPRDEPLLGSFDPTQLAQVINNLVMNAVQSMPNGGVVTLSCGELTCAPPGSDAAPSRHLWLCVSDQGEGMTPEQRARIFEPFFTTKETGEGTGLGLPVSAGIVKDHQGWFDVVSERGHGSKFTVYLPG